MVQGIKIKITAKFRASRRLRFEDTKRIVTRNAPEKSRGFRETGPRTIYLIMYTFFIFWFSTFSSMKRKERKELKPKQTNSGRCLYKNTKDPPSPRTDWRLESTFLAYLFPVSPLTRREHFLALIPAFPIE